MKAVKSIGFAITATVFYGLFAWFAMILCLLLGVWGAVPDIIFILLIILGKLRLAEWMRQRHEIGLVLFTVTGLGVPVLLWSGAFAMINYLQSIGRWSVEINSVSQEYLVTLAATVCTGITLVMFLAALWIGKMARKKS